MRRIISLIISCLLISSMVEAAEKKKVEVLKVKEEAPQQEQGKAEGDAKRFVDNGDGSVTDRNSGLIWLKDADISKAPLPLRSVKQYIEEMNAGKRENFGYNNWRLPSINEIELLIDRSRIYPAISTGHPFLDVRSDFYWTSSESNEIVDYVWILDIASGIKISDFISDCSFRYFWPVRDATAAEVQSAVITAAGLNDHGQLGNGYLEEEREAFSAVSGISDVIRMAAGSEHAVAIKADGTVWTWGRNAEGQLGDGTTDDRSIPVMVKGLWNITDVAAGMYHTVALRSDGTAWAWGRNYYGQLGNGTIEDSSSPVQVKVLTNVVRIFSGYYHSFALKADGTVWAWGWNNYGQLGEGSTSDSRTPVQIERLSDIVDIVAGINHSVALKKDGTVWAWGWNLYGLLGNDSKEDSRIPIQVKGLSDITDIAAGMYHTVALKSDGTVWAWGKNEYGQLGSASSKGSVPAKVDILTKVRLISAGMYHSAAIKEDGTLWLWGQDLQSKKQKSGPVARKDVKSGVLSVDAGKYYTLLLTRKGR